MYEIIRNGHTNTEIGILVEKDRLSFGRIQLHRGKNTRKRWEHIQKMEL